MDFRIDIITDPMTVWESVKSYLSDDYEVGGVDGTFLGVFDGGSIAGAFLVKAWNTHCYEIHGGVIKEYWGFGDEICLALGNYLFDFTPCLKIIAPVPSYNRLMISCLKRCGLREEGRITKSILKDFRLHDILMYSITKQERSLPCQQ